MGNGLQEKCSSGHFFLHLFCLKICKTFKNVGIFAQKMKKNGRKSDFFVKKFGKPLMFGIYLQKITEICGEKLKKMIKTLGQKSLCHYLCTRFWNFDDKTGDKNLHM